jgi:hypothetical protein
VDFVDQKDDAELVEFLQGVGIEDFSDGSELLQVAVA